MAFGAVDSPNQVDAAQQAENAKQAAAAKQADAAKPTEAGNKTDAEKQAEAAKKAEAKKVETGVKAAEGDKPAKPTVTDSIVAVLKAIKDLMVATSWAIVALLLALVFRAPLVVLLKKVTDAVGSSAVTFDVGTVFKVQVTEPTVAPSDDRRQLWAASPFEIEEETARDPTSAFQEVATQLTLPVSDYVAQYWATHGKEAAAAAMRQARSVLATACADRSRDFASLRGVLDSFVDTLDASLFLEADQFAVLLGDSQVLRQGVEALAPKDPVADAKDFLVLHAAGAAYAQAADWERAGNALDKIVWNDAGKPLYLPAGSVWLTTHHHIYIQEIGRTHPEIELDSTEFFAKVQGLIAKTRTILQSLRTATPLALQRRGFFVRELLKDLGSIGSIIADYSTSEQDVLFAQADRDLNECAAEIDGTAGSPLDHNNLADLYRQMGDVAKQNKPGTQDAYYAKAHAQLDAAFLIDTSDPAFCHTRALVYFSQRRCDEGLRALDLYQEAQAEKARARDIEQYVDNQILGAKLLAASRDEDEPPDLARITWVLGRAKQFLNKFRGTLGDVTADRQQAQIEELLGYAYLQWPRRESSALEAFDRLFDLRKWTPMLPTTVRCRLWRARALIRVARTRRREFSREVATQHRARARADLAQVVRLIESLKADASVPLRRRERNVRLRLDTAICLQFLAEEHFAGEDLTRAKDLLAEETTMLASLDNSSLPGSVGSDILEQLKRSRARLAFLSGRILIRMAPHTEELIGTVEEKFDDGRGVSPEQDCQIDLELGELLLSSARLGFGQPMRLYDRAVASFERAAGRTAPALRADTIKALSAAYAMRETIVRLAKAGAPSGKGAK